MSSSAEFRSCSATIRSAVSTSGRAAICLSRD